MSRGPVRLVAGLLVAMLAPQAGCNRSDRAPELNLTKLSGEPLRLEDYRGQVVLIDFWATWCGPCRMAVPHLIDLQTEYGPRGFQVIGVAVSDNEANVRLFTEAKQINYLIAMGTPEVVEAYGGFTAIPTAFLIAPNGTIAARYTGYQDKQVFVEAIEKLLPPVRASG
jgi:thiol-disulfide isomerase/thioredoxin